MFLNGFVLSIDGGWISIFGKLGVFKCGKLGNFRGIDFGVTVGIGVIVHVVLNDFSVDISLLCFGMLGVIERLLQNLRWRF